MRLDEWHVFFVSICFILILATISPFVMTFIPGKVEPFFTLAILGEDGKISNYFPSEEHRVDNETNMSWKIYLYNHMGETKYISVQIKLLNSTMISPNSTSVLACPYLTLYEFRRILLHNETSLLPLNWSLLQFDFTNVSSTISTLKINGEIIYTNTTVVNGDNFRIVLELWMYDRNVNKFIFGWKTSHESYGPWNQVWFNLIQS